MTPLKFDLASRAKSKKPIVLANIKPTHAQELTLFAIYNQIVKLWAEASRKIVAAYAANLSEGSPNGPGDAAREIDRTAADAQRVLLLLIPGLTVWASRIEKVHGAKWAKTILSATKVDLKPLLSPSDMNAIVKASADWNAAMIKDISAETQRRISNIVFSGFQQKASVFDVAKEISKSIGMARGRARNVAKDQLNKLGSALNKARQEQANISHYIWRHSAKLHARPVHLARNGKLFPWNGPGAVPADDECGVPPFCGCVAQAVLVPADEPTA